MNIAINCINLFYLLKKEMVGDKHSSSSRSALYQMELPCRKDSNDRPPLTG